MHTALTIAGVDGSGGAGILADVKTMTAHGVYAMSAVAALTVQNTTGVFGVETVSPAFLEDQIRVVFEDIPPESTKTGMLFSAELICAAANRLRIHHAPHVVVDPVMVATSGARLLREDAVEALCRELLPLAEVVTPNLPELAELAGLPVDREEERVAAAAALWERYGCAVLCKGGHDTAAADDLLFDGAGPHWYRGKRVETRNTHGTGCTLSAAIASNLALGLPLPDAVGAAKDYLTGALAAGLELELGRGSGPLDHCYRMKGEH